MSVVRKHDMSRRVLAGSLFLFLLISFLPSSLLGDFRVDRRSRMEGKGEVPPQSVLEVTLMGESVWNIPSVADREIVAGPYLKLTFEDNHVGEQVLLIFTENPTEPNASGGRRGLVSRSDRNVRAPIYWTALDQPVEDLSGLVVREIPERAESAWPAGDVILAREIDGKSAVLFPQGSGSLAGVERTCSDGEFYIALSTGGGIIPAGNYSTRLTIQLATQEADGSFTPLIARTVTLEATK